MTGVQTCALPIYSLQRNAGVIPGIEPGEATAQHLDHVVSYTTCAGAVYLTAVFLIPHLLSVYGAAPFYLAGTSVLVAVWPGKRSQWSSWSGRPMGVLVMVVS